MTIGDQPQYLQRQFAHLHLGDNRTRLQTYPENPVNLFTMPSPPPQNNYNSNMPQQGVAGAPNEQALLLLMERTGYSMIQENGQRKYGGPPPAWEGAVPSRGCEIFVGKIPRDCYEDELVPVFEKIGHIYELRLMMDFSGTNRGYCFVTYSHRDEAKRAVKDLNNHEIRKGRYLGVCLSVDNCRLFVGGIPKNKTRDEILQEMVKVTEGVVDVIVYPSATDKTKNRGFAFVEYESHRAAAMARRKLIPGRIQLFGHQIAVDWAEPETDVDEDIMSKVKILYVRNLMLTTTEDYIKDTFQKAAGKDNCVERVKKIRDYAFVHFREREDALRAMNATNNSSLEGSMIEVSLAKPVDKNEYVRSTRGVGRGGSNTAATLQQIYPYGGLDLQGYTTPAATAAYLQYNPTTAAAAAAAAAVAARGIGRGTGRLGMRGRGRGAAGMRGAGGRTYLAGRTGMTYRKQAPELITTRTHISTTSPLVLEEFCQKNGWGQPIYQLHSTVGRDGSGDVQLFLYKVSIPALASQYPNSTFQPNKLCRSVDEAKQYAAEYVLMQLGVPMETHGDLAAYDAAFGHAFSAAAALAPATYATQY